MKKDLDLEKLAEKMRENLKEADVLKNMNGMPFSGTQLDVIIRISEVAAVLAVKHYNDLPDKE